MSQTIEIPAEIAGRLTQLSDAETKMLLLLLILAAGAGPDNRRVQTSYRELAQRLGAGWSASKVCRVLSSLETPAPGEEKAYLSVSRSPSKYAETEIRIYGFGTPKSGLHRFTHETVEPERAPHRSTSETVSPKTAFHRFTGETVSPKTAVHRSTGETVRPDSAPSNAPDSSFQRNSEGIPPLTPPLPVSDRLDWAPWPDAEHALQAILGAYPKPGPEGRARIAWAVFLDAAQHLAPRQARVMLAKAQRLADHWPEAERRFLPSLADFLRERWTEDWDSILAARQSPGRSHQAGPSTDLASQLELRRQRR